MARGLALSFYATSKGLKPFFISSPPIPKILFRTIRNELEKYNKSLLEKKEYVFLSKSDLLNEKEIGEKINELKETGREVIPISIIDEKSIKKVEEILREITKQKHK